MRGSIPADVFISTLLGRRPAQDETVAGDPSGVLTRAPGTIVRLADQSRAWMNVDGATVWLRIDDLLVQRNVAYPERHGAVGNGVHDDTAAIQAAADSLAATGGEVRLQDATYLISSRIVLPNGVSLAGTAVPIDMGVHVPSPITGTGSLMVSAQAADFSFVKLGNRSQVRRVNFDATSDAVIPSAGRVLDFSSVYGTVIEDCFINRCYMGVASIHTSQFAQVFSLKRVRVMNVVRSGIELAYAVVGTVDECFSYNRVDAGASFYKHGAGAYLTGGTATIAFTKCIFGDMQDGVRCTGVGSHENTTMVGDITFTDCCFDTPGRVGAYLTSIINSNFKGCFFGGSDQTDVWIDGNSDDVVFTGNQFVGSNLSSITLASTGLNGIVISGSNTFSACVRSGGAPVIEVYAGVSGFKIDGNIMKPTTQWGTAVGHHTYGVRIATGTSDYFSVIGNIIAGSSTGRISDGSTGTHKDVTTGNVG
jgi:hypothetical protein